MPAKTTTQKLDIRWQDRSWQPRIRSAASRPGQSAASAIASRFAEPVARPAVRPCRRGMTVCLVRHVILAFRPGRRS